MDTSPQTAVIDAPAADPAARRGGGTGQLQERAYAELKRLMISGTFPPGSFLSERRLAEQLGMSKTPVHVALERLRAEGYVDVSPQMGVVVRELSVQEIADHYDLREGLESHVLRRLAGRLTPAQAGQVRRHLDRQRAAAEAGSVAENAELDGEFHLMFCGFLGNQLIGQVMWQLRDRIHRVIVQAFTRDPGRVVESLAEHVRIADAVIEGRADDAAAAVVEHLEIGKQRIFLPARR